MFSNDIPRSQQAPSHGLSSRPPTASTPLWAHILQPKQRSSQVNLADIPGAIPLSAPLDKNATSMRILLHDTQANLEKFGVHVQSLLEGVKEARQEMKVTNALFERDRESLVGDITDLINRSQKEIQKSIGTPAQDECIQSFFKDISSRLSGLDQRIDALQVFNQTHSQALQTQVQALQILMNKQGDIITAVLPLLPLLQALPLHIDAAKTSIRESITKASSFPVSTISKAKDDFVGALTNKRKRTEGHSFSSPTSVRAARKLSGKRLRTARSGLLQSESNTELPSFQITESSPQCQNFGRPNLSLRPGKSPPEVSTTNENPSADSIIPRKGSRAFAARDFTTPRRPLGDLLPLNPPQNHIATPQRQSLPLSRAKSISSSALLPSKVIDATSTSTITPTLRKSGFLDLGTTLTVARTPLNVHANNSRLDSLRSSARKTTDVQIQGSSIVPNEPSSLAASVVRGNVPSASDRALSSIPGPDPLQNVTREPGHLATRTPERVTTPQRGWTHVPRSVILGKERRSPMRERRRFIPLVDSDDEED